MAQREGPRQYLERRLPRLTEFGRPIAAAALVTLVLDLLLPPRESRAEIIALFVGYPLAVGIALLIGYWLGQGAWNKRGRRLTRLVLRRAAKSKRQPILFLTARPDFETSLWRRVLEVVGFAAGAAVLIPAVLQVLGAPAGAVQVAGGLVTIVALWGSFVLVPYWTLSRLGVRRVDPVRWVVEPLGFSYAERLRLSNGALLVIAAAAAVNLAYRAGASGDEALLQGVLTVTQLVASILVIATAGVVYYARVEKEIVHEMQEEALRIGIRDGRAMSDGEFLPALPRA